MGGCGGEDRGASPIHNAGQLGASSKAGRTGSLNFPECVLGEGSAPSWERFLTLRPLAAQAPSPHACPRPRGGVRRRGWKGHFLRVWGERKLANEGQKGWGRRNYFFFDVLKTNSSQRVSPATLPAALAPWAPTHPPSEPLPTLIPGLVATARRRNRTSSHVSRVSRGPARPAPPPWRGRRRARGPECGRRAPCGAPAGEPAPGRPRLVRAGRGAGGLGWLLGGPLGISSWFRAGGVLFITIFFNGRALLKPRPKGAEALLAGRGGRQGPARLWHDCLPGAGLPFCHRGCCRCGGWGEQSCAITQTALDVETAGGAGSGDPQLYSGPRWGFPPGANSLRLCWGVQAAFALGGRRSSVRVLPPTPIALPTSPAPLL